MRITSGRLQEWVDSGVRGLTSNPSIFEKAISTSDAYDKQFKELILSDRSVEEAYWELVITDIAEQPTYLIPFIKRVAGLTASCLWKLIQDSQEIPIARLKPQEA